MADYSPYREFTQRLKLLISKHPALITTTLSNIFTMRLIGNKTHGDLAEIAIPEFINQYMYDYSSIHVGKDLYRAKEQEEDITIINDITEQEVAVSLKAYGNEFLQLSTDKEFRMFPLLSSQGEDIIRGNTRIKSILESPEFSAFEEINTLALIYNEKQMKCNMLVFDADLAKTMIETIRFIPPGGRRKHPVFRFFDAEDGYICEVRYGDATANALQRGLWTHTKNAITYFESLTGGWVDYSHNLILVNVFSHALVASKKGHIEALESVKSDIKEIIQGEGL
ncbi:MAG: hypothetical protein OXT68_16465 [Chloroflexota bacterium]|nr:hypothetical protein [Chloroflexota bacterium]MDE2952347.1 hypothetical protein [Chloroflexota bacterium]